MRGDLGEESLSGEGFLQAKGQADWWSSDANPNRHALRPNKNIGILAQEN